MSRNKSNWDFLVNADGQYDLVSGQKGQKGSPGGQKGLKGAAGVKGATGADGTNGTNGDKGQKGEIGVGQKGITGTGDKGNKGASGAASAKGDKGLTGLKGSQGDKGLTGAGTKGITGEKGVSGGAGPKGLKGTDGATAQKGNTGTTGAKGLTGAKGIDGVKGIAGAASAKGQKGQDGLKGLKGLKGADIKGQKGQDGAKGVAAALLDFKGGVATIGDLPAQPAPAGDTYLVQDTNIYYSSNGTVWTAQGAVLKGEKGLKGQKGLGDKGVKGADGQKGITGLKGLKGVDGAVGPKGLTGAKGINGVKGLKGQGVKGEKGLKGLKGAPAPLLDFLGNVATLANLPAQPQTAGDTYLVVDESIYYTSDGSAWNASGTVIKGEKGLKGNDSGGVGGANTQVQFNDSGSFGGNANLTWNSGTNTLGTTAISAANVTTSGTLNSLDATILGASASSTITPNGRFDAGLVPTTNDTIDVGTAALRWRNVYVQALRAGGVTYPSILGSNGEVLTSNGSGNAEWESVISATADNQVLYNKNGVINGENAFSYDRDTNTLDVANITAITVDVSSTLSANAGVTLGNDTSDTPAINGRLTTDIIPRDNNTSDLGDPTHAWQEIYGQTVTATNVAASNLTASVALTVNGSTTLGDQTTDGITFTGRAISNLTPFTNNSVDLGGPSLKWNNIYVNLLHAGGVTYPNADGTAGQILSTDGSGTLSFIANDTTPAGNDSMVQFNSAGNLAADTGLTYNAASNTLSADALIASGLTYPTADGTAGQVLSTDGSGALGFVTQVSTPGGSTTEVQFNNAGTLDGDAGLTYNATTDTLTGVNIAATDVTTTTLNTTGNVVFGSAAGGATETVTFDALLSGNLDPEVSNASFLGAARPFGGIFTSSLTVNSAATLGSANTDTVTVNGRFNTDLDPRLDNNNSLGSASLRWRQGNFVDTISTTVTTTNLFSGGVAYPTADGTNGQVLVTDGAGNLDFQTNTPAPAGSSTYVQFNNGGTALGGSSSLTFNDGTDTLTTVNAVATTVSTGSLTTSGLAALNGTLTVGGNTTLGNANTDTVTFTARPNSDILPSNTNSFDLGSTSNKWAEAHVRSVFTGTVNADAAVVGSLSTAGATTIGDQTVDAVSFNARLITDLIPQVTDTVDLGTSALAFNNVYSANLITETLSAEDVLLANNNAALTFSNGGNDYLVFNTTAAQVEVDQNLVIGSTRTFSLGGVVVDDIQKSTDSFVDSDTDLMTAGAIKDLVDTTGGVVQTTGTFTGTFRGSTGEPATLKTINGFYVKTNSLVTASFTVGGTDYIGYTGAASITGLPFTSTTSSDYVGTVWQTGALDTSATGIVARILSNSDVVRFYADGSNAAVTWQGSTVTNLQWRITITYSV